MSRELPGPSGLVKVGHRNVAVPIAESSRSLS